MSEHNAIKLLRVWINEDHFVESDDICEVWLKNDGNGPMGHYDRVHASWKDGEYVIYPAHNLHKLEYFGKPSDD